jgi:hypothetical protein
MTHRPPSGREDMMRNTPLGALATPLRQIPRELLNIIVAAAAFFAVILLGGLIAAILPAQAHSPWWTLACYAAPASVAFVIYWWMDQRH